MPIYQTNLWVCELCNKVVSTSKEVGAYDDPVVTYPHGDPWDYVRVAKEERLACPDCVARYSEPEPEMP